MDIVAFIAGLCTLPAIVIAVVSAILISDRVDRWRADREYKKTWKDGE